MSQQAEIEPEGSPARTESPALPPGGDRRVWVRTPCQMPGACQPVSLPTASAPEQKWHGQIQDISAGGIKLTLVRRFEPGAALIIELADRVGQDPVLRTATVVYVAPLPSAWALGCKFDTPLDEELLAVLLQPSAPPPAANSPVETRPTAAQAFWSGAGSTRGATPPS